MRDIGSVSAPRLVTAIVAALVVLFVGLAIFETIYSELRHLIRGE
ncbi:hypothetical protein [Halocatena salina]|nr:hypothetical protein [Halocatena salina]